MIPNNITVIIVERIIKFKSVEKQRKNKALCQPWELKKHAKLLYQNQLSNGGHLWYYMKNVLLGNHDIMPRLLLSTLMTMNPRPMWIECLHCIHNHYDNDKSVYTEWTMCSRTTNHLWYNLVVNVYYETVWTVIRDNMLNSAFQQNSESQMRDGNGMFTPDIR